VRDSSIDGRGLFAGGYIPPGFDKLYSAGYPNTLDRSQRAEFEKYASFDGEVWTLSGDGAVFINRSDEPNLAVAPGPRRPSTRDLVAVKSILPGEELTMDYGEVGIDS